MGKGRLDNILTKRKTYDSAVHWYETRHTVHQVKIKKPTLDLFGNRAEATKVFPTPFNNWFHLSAGVH